MRKIIIYTKKPYLDYRWYQVIKFKGFITGLKNKFGEGMIFLDIYLARNKIQNTPTENYDWGDRSWYNMTIVKDTMCH